MEFKIWILIIGGSFRIVDLYDIIWYTRIIGDFEKHYFTKNTISPISSQNQDLSKIFQYLYTFVSNQTMRTLKTNWSLKINNKIRVMKIIQNMLLLNGVIYSDWVSFSLKVSIPKSFISYKGRNEEKNPVYSKMPFTKSIIKEGYIYII